MLKLLRKPLALGLLSVAIPAVAAVGQASAAELDLTNGTSASTPCTGNSGQCGGYMNIGGFNFYSFAGALWSTTTIQPTGSGFIDSFVRIQDSNSSVVDGHNTSGTLLNQEKPGPTFTHDVLTSQVGTVNIGGTTYFQFLLDINQQGGDPLLSLSGLQLCTSATAGLSFTNTCAGTDNNNGGGATGSASLRYNLDAGANNQVLLDYRDNAGSGSGDLFVYIPTSVLPATDNTYLYLWSQFGLKGSGVDPLYDNNDGYEEWAFKNVRVGGGTPDPFNVSQAPEPATLIMLGTGLLMGGAAVRRRNRKTTSENANPS